MGSYLASRENFGVDLSLEYGVFVGGFSTTGQVEGKSDVYRKIKMEKLVGDLNSNVYDYNKIKYPIARLHLETKSQLDKINSRPTDYKEMGVKPSQLEALSNTVSATKRISQEILRRLNSQ